MFLKNTASQFLYFTMVSTADGSALSSAVSGYRTIDGGSQNAVTGSLSHKGNGQWQLALSAADINGDNIGFLFTHATGINVSISILTTVKSLDTLQDITAANVRTQCDDALTAYAPNTVAPNTVIPDVAGTAAGLHGTTDAAIATRAPANEYDTQLDANMSSRAAAGDAMSLVNDAITSAKYDESTAFPVKLVDSGATKIARTGADGDTLETLSDQLDTSGAIAGAGAITFIYTLTSSVDGSPIADADIWVTSDLAGANVIASGKTDQYGKVTFYLDAGTVYIWRQKSSWDFTNPDTETVV